MKSLYPKLTPFCVLIKTLTNLHKTIIISIVPLIHRVVNILWIKLWITNTQKALSHMIFNMLQAKWQILEPNLSKQTISYKISVRKYTTLSLRKLVSAIIYQTSNHRNYSLANAQGIQDA